jgi:hypothetical protein
MARPALPREGLLARRADAEAPAQEGETKQSPESRVGGDDCELAAFLAKPSRRTMEDAEKICVSAVSPAKVDDDARMAEAHCQVHAAHDILGVRMTGAFEDRRRTCTGVVLLVDLDHRSGVPVTPGAETWPN